MQSLTQQFTDWVSTKPADEGYNYWDTCGCACGQFFAFMGIDSFGDDAAMNARLRIEGDFRKELQAQPQTFGQLAQRLATTLTPAS